MLVGTELSTATPTIILQVWQCSSLQEEGKRKLITLGRDLEDRVWS